LKKEYDAKTQPHPGILKVVHIIMPNYKHVVIIDIEI